METVAAPKESQTRVALHGVCGSGFSRDGEAFQKPKSMPWASGSSVPQLIVLVWRRM